MLWRVGGIYMWVVVNIDVDVGKRKEQQRSTPLKSKY